MKQVLSGKYTIAWFKLADCISRGEKERALGIYRLLAHSLDNPALIQQLEGDILLAFDDPNATEKYEYAAQLYEKSGKLLEAAAVYEHVLSFTNNNSYRKLLIELYQELSIVSKVVEHQHALFAVLLADQQWEDASQVAEKFGNQGIWQEAAPLYEQLIFTLLEADSSHNMAMYIVQKVINAWLRAAGQQQLEEFLTKLKAKNEDLHARACAQIGEEK